PITPARRIWTGSKGMQQHAHLARFCRGVALPLALVAQRAGAATANTGRIHHAHASVSFPTPLMGTKRLACWTPKRPIRLECKVLSREAARFPRRVAVEGGPYPDAGGGEGDEAVACSLC